MTRRELLAATTAASPLFAGRRMDRSRFSPMTDEIAASEREAFAFTRQYQHQ